MSRILPKVLVTTAAVLVIAIRIIWPNLNIDAITLGLLFLALLPWVSDLVKSAELPGGWKIEFHDIESAGAKIVAEPYPEGGDSNGQSVVATTSPLTSAVHPDVAPDNPNLALVGLRVEIENRIRQLAKLAGVNATRSLMTVFGELRARDIVTEPSASGLHDLIIAGNQAAHGAAVDPAVSEWSVRNGPRILGVLDQAVQRVARDAL